ncbi:MAG: glycine zipper 2TM domain-containing protein [Rhodocyclaceae bacterium]|nr:glycine zipper 2TM domain-containing protein [Rhodocyclaceae bacterium]
MNTETTPSRLHPLVATAAVAVTVLSLTGIAAMLGYLPMGKSATPAETVAAVPASVAAVPPAPTLAPPQAVNEPLPTEKKAEKPAPKPVAKAPQPAAPTVAPTMPATSTLPPPVAAPAPCPNCGVIDNIREVTQAGEGSGLGAVAGGVVGAIVGNQIGGGTGKKIATVAGAAGGAYAGHQVEKNQKKTTHYEITVRMKDGSLRSLTQNSPPAWRIGDRVRVEDGGLVGDN